MPLHFGKIAGAIVFLTILAFVLWMFWGSLFQGARAEAAPGFETACSTGQCAFSPKSV